VELFSRVFSPILHRWSNGFLARAFACISVGSIIAAGVGSTLPWRWSSPTPFGFDVADFAFRSNRVYVAVGDHGSIFVSDDAASWRRRSPGLTNSLRSTTYFNNRILAVGAAGAALWSDTETFTTLDLGTTNNLEGVAASSDLAVAVGDRAAVYVSTLGSNWVQVNPGFTNWLRSAAYGNGIFVTVGESGLIATSTDGKQWQRRAVAGFTKSLNRVIWNGAGFTAVGQAGVVVMSSDSQGAVWNLARSTGTSSDLFLAAIDSQNLQLIGGTSALLSGATTLAGFRWTDETSSVRASPAPSLTYLSALWDGTRFILGAQGGILVTGQRTDPQFGYLWSYNTTNLYANLWDTTVGSVVQTNIVPVYDGGQVAYQTNRATNTSYFAAGSNASLAVSPDGAQWSLAFAPSSSANENFFGIASSPNLLAAVGSGGTIAISPSLYSSVSTTNWFTNNTQITRVVTTNQLATFGLGWYAANSKINQDLQGIAYSGGTFAACGGAGIVLTSDDGTNWTKHATGVTNFLSSICAWPGGWIAAGTGGVVLSSTNGTKWSVAGHPSTNWLWRVRWLQDRLFVVGQNGTLLSSTNGTSWQSLASGTTGWLSDLNWVSGVYFAAGDDGVVLSSTNGVAWDQLTPAFSSSIYSLAAIDGQLVATGSTGAILRAQVTPFTTPIQILKWPQQSSENLFLLAGHLDQPFQVAHSTNLVEWVGSEPLEISNSDGTLLWLDPAPLNDLLQYFSGFDLP
jgi:hypothetical protein